jgi:hypothetical protein
LAAVGALAAAAPAAPAAGTAVGAAAAGDGGAPLDRVGSPAASGLNAPLSADAAAPGAGGPVVLIGFTGLTWQDVSAEATGTIWRLLARGAGAAAMLNRSVRVGSCPAEGWLAVGAGRRIGEVAPGALSDLKGADGSGCRALAEPVGGQIPDWSGLTGAAVAAGEGASIGRLAGWLAESAVSAAAIGPGGAIALAGPSGRVETAYQPAPSTPEGWPLAVARAIGAGAELLVVDAGAVGPDLGPEQLDARIGALIEALEQSAQPTRIVVASLADRSTPALGVALDWRLAASAGAAASGPAGGGAGQIARTGPALIESAETKTPGLVRVTELTAVLESSLIPAPVGPVDPWTAGARALGVADLGAAAAQARLADLDRHAVAARQWGQTGWFLAVAVAALGIFWPLAAAARRGPRRAWAFGRWLALAAGAFPAASLAANAIPWWRTPLAPLVWFACASILALAAGAAAVAAGWRRRGRPAASALVGPGTIGLISALIVAVDPFAGRVFTRDAPLGYSTLLASRVYGFSNSVFAVLATGAILGAAVVAAGAWAKGKRFGAAAPIAAIGLAVLTLDAHPSLGANLGGSVGIVGGFVVMTAMAADLRLNWKWLAVAAGAGVAAAGAIAWLDYQRGPGRWTHLGGFVETVIGGGLGEVLVRKGLVWLRLSVGPAAGLAVGALICLHLARRAAFAGLRTSAWTATPLIKPMFAGLITAWAIGSLVNDSGLVVAVIGLAVAGPPLSFALSRAGLIGSGSPPAGRGGPG